MVGAPTASIVSSDRGPPVHEGERLERHAAARRSPSRGRSSPVGVLHRHPVRDPAKKRVMARGCGSPFACARRGTSRLRCANVAIRHAFASQWRQISGSCANAGR
ncbi:MAG: hypothetical protein BGO98_03010 [Myxococcales bacterium 68-20]|nr:MAG: hypothetical protein BGO98_03010 [Myxococcales bacterium 68-20]